MPRTQKSVVKKFVAITIILMIVMVIVVVTEQHISKRNTSYIEFLHSSFDIDTILDNGQTVQIDYSEIYDHTENSKQTWQSSNLAETVESTTPSNPYAYPETILPCTKSGDDLLVLVNKQYQLPSTYAPSDLVSASQSGIRTTKTGLIVRNTIIPDLTALVNTVQIAGIDLAILSAYRSYATQQSTYNYWVEYNGGDSATADMISARAGHSQHQLGTAVDFTTNEINDELGQHFENTVAEQWLAEHAWEYGFVLGYPAGQDSITGYSYEPWHFRYIGVSNAKDWHDSGLILELWLR